MQGIPPRVIAGFAGAALLAAGAVVVIPSTAGNGESLSTVVLVTTAAVVAALTGLALYVGLRLDLGFPASVAVFTVAFNVLVVFVKFVLGPQALYEASRLGKLDTDFGSLETAAYTAVGVGALYLLAFWILYRLARRRIERPRRMSPQALAVGGVVLALALVSGGLPIVLVLLYVFAGGPYLTFVFTSTASLVAGVALATAAAVAGLALTTAAERARVLGDATLLTTLFWVGAAYLALYHALWVVYILVLTAVWPLKVVTSK